MRFSFDTFVALLFIGLLGGLIAVAAMATSQAVAGAVLLPTATPEMAAWAQAAIPTVTRIPRSPTPTVSPTVTRPPTETPRPTRTPDPNRSPTATYTPRPTGAATVDPEDIDSMLDARLTVTATLTRTPKPTITPLPSPTVRATPNAIPHFWLARPIGADANDTLALFYPYASTGEGMYPVHHGVEFVNEIGTPILAAADGEVVVAMFDDQQVVGPVEWSAEEDGPFYGNVVVIRHNLMIEGQPIFTLYGHMDEYLVEVGQRVEQGQEIGRVGATGIAIGPHLHFEVRVGDNHYHSVQNPQLWLPPKPGFGLIVGQVLDANGAPIPNAFVSIQKAGEEKTFQYEYSYEVDIENPTPPDLRWQENFVMGGVPTGSYVLAVTINGRAVLEQVEVRDGEITWVWLD